MNLWNEQPKGYDKMTTIEYFPAEKKYSDCVFVIFPGGGYTHLAKHEGEGYAKQLNCWGIDAYVVQYSVAPTSFPAQLNDARRAVQIVRGYAQERGYDPNKILAMGSSAGGHLTAMLSTCKEVVEQYENDDISKLPYLPNYQVLCYPVIDMINGHSGSKNMLIGENASEELARKVSPQLCCDGNTPPAFIWHNMDDMGVNVMNSLNYVKSLKEHNVPAELHVFPYGAHGVGLAANKHCGQWATLLFNWLKEMKIY